MTPEREAQMRKIFEKWAREQRYPIYDLVVAGGPTSSMPGTRERFSGLAWEGFLACARALEPKWQPIETAPRDGTHVLLWATRGSLLYPTQEQIVGRFSRGWWGADHVLSHVTHWMPLPEQPKAAMSAALEDGNATE